MAHVREVQRRGGKCAHEVRWREHGKDRQRTFTVKREAERFAARVETEIASGNDVRPLAHNKVTVRDAVKEVLAAEEHRLKPRTLDSYRKIYEKRIGEKFGRDRLSAVTRARVQAWITELVEGGLSPGTVKRHYVALRKLFKWAIKEGLLGSDPCEHVALPREENLREHPILTLAQLERLADALSSRPPYDLLVRFMALTGLRAGEVIGLRVSDVELANRRVLVRQTRQRIAGKGWVIGTPKSKRSTREVPLLDSQLISDLRTYLLAHPKSGQPDALFWPGRAPGSRELDFDRVLDGSTFARNHFKPALEKAKLPQMRIHDLRHTAASLWLAAGFQSYEVSRWLGHANVSTTDGIYAHLYPSDYETHLSQFEAYQEREKRRVGRPAKKIG